MAKRYVERNVTGDITVVHKKPGRGREEIDEFDAELDPILRPPAKTAGEIVDDVLASDEVLDAIVTEMANMASITKTAMVDRIKAHVAAP